jgi:hypothetical protein
MDRENQRYIEYFQRQLALEGADNFWQGQNEWFEKNRSAIAERCLSFSREAGDRLQVLAESVLAHENQDEYENFFAKQIFEPLVQDALEICEQNGIAPRNPIRFVNSPGLDPSPVALPSTAEHLLFAGQGTFAFCNYWSKVFSSAIAEVAELPTEERSSPEAAIEKLRQGRVLQDATELAIRYAECDSLLGFGRIEQPSELLAFRVMLLNAMEIFAIGHEIGHFLAHESHPETSGIRPGQDFKAHEIECDVIGLAISTAYGVREGNPFAFQLIGPLLLFYALRTCEEVKLILFDEEPSPSDTHPSHEERFKHTLDFLYEAGASEHIKASVHFVLDVAMYVGSQVQMIVRDLKTHASKK